MSNFFFPAPEVATVGHDLIERHHHHLIDYQVRVEFVFCSETPAKGGKLIWGTARKVGSLNSYLKRENEVDWAPGLSDEEIAAIEDEDERDVAKLEKTLARDNALEKGNAPFFVITISKPIWDTLSEEHRVALVDHELMHCGASWDDKGKTKLVLIGHDFEGFNAEISRHGLWRPDAARLADTMKNAQLGLDFGAEEVALEPDAKPEKEALTTTFSSGGKSVTLTDADFAEIADSLSPAPKKRGRPRKNQDSAFAPL
ncbi:MAG: hypothetical protein KY445_00940 [Armatimonadetes bacterium]|nr:hypothetical protein [Armatimonadota bacterium]